MPAKKPTKSPRISGPPVGRMHQQLHLQHHKHTGKLLHHRHTSYRGLAVVVVLAGLFMIGLSIMAKATAATLYVYATVPASIPTTPAVITQPTDGPVSRPSFTVSGTCPTSTPPVIVVILLDGAEVGSNACASDGTFALPIEVSPGQHTLRARIFTITGDTGPDSTIVYISYAMPATHAPTLPDTHGTNQPSPLSFAQSQPFIVFGPGADAIWTGTITGGVPPYHVHINWGDGTSSDYTVSAAGDRNFRHHYRAMKSYDITMTVTDSGGRTQTTHYAAVTPYRPPASLLGAVPHGPTSPLSGGRLFGIYGSYLLLLVIFGIAWKRRREFAYAKVPARPSRPFMLRFGRSYSPLSPVSRTKTSKHR